MKLMQFVEEVGKTRWDTLIGIVEGPFLIINDAIILTVDAFVLRFYNAFWVRIGPYEANLSTARAALFAGVFGIMLFCLGGFYDAIGAFTEPFKAGPTFNTVKAPSGAQMLLKVVLWGGLSFGAGWIAIHVLTSAFMPFDFYIPRFRSD